MNVGEWAIIQIMPERNSKLKLIEGGEWVAEMGASKKLQMENIKNEKWAERMPHFRNWIESELYNIYFMNFWFSPTGQSRTHAEPFFRS